MRRYLLTAIALLSVLCMSAQSTSKAHTMFVTLNSSFVRAIDVDSIRDITFMEKTPTSRTKTLTCQGTSTSLLKHVRTDALKDAEPLNFK